MDMGIGSLQPVMHDPDAGWVVRGHAEVRSVLEDGRFLAPPADSAGPPGGLRWLRASVARFADGAEHERRRAIARGQIDRLDARRLRAEAARWTAGAGPRGRRGRGSRPGGGQPDPAVFADPHRFDPGRVEPRHLTFGHGLRPCPGGGHALALAAGVVETVVARCWLADAGVAFEPSPNLRIPSRLEVARR